MTKPILALAGLSLASFFAAFAGSASLQHKTDDTAAKTAAPEFKNIQVLKTIPADQLVPTMRFISASLGVECDFCHVEHEMDKDDKKPKKVAREMMTMMFAINKNNFEGEREVTCNTCHRGSPHPQAIPAIMVEAVKPAAPDHAGHDDNAAASLPSGAPLMDKYLQALGGTAALNKVASRVEQGSALMGADHKLPIEVYAKSPDQRVSVMKMPNGDSVTAYNGHEGWLAVPGRPARDMSAADQYAAKLDATVFFPAQLAAMFDELKLQPQPETVGDHAASVVVALAKGQPPVKLYFDQQSGMLVRMVHYTDTALGLNPTQMDFADYREVNGVKTPFRWTIARPGGGFTIQIDKVEDNAPIDAVKFVKPPTPPPAAPPNATAH